MNHINIRVKFGSRIINKDGIVSESKVEICNELNTFLVNVRSYLEIEHLKNSNKFLFDNKIIKNSLFFKPIDTDEIKSLLAKIKNSSSFYETDFTNYLF